MALIKGLFLLLFINSLNASLPNEDVQFVVNNENADVFLRTKIGNLELSIGEKIILKTKLQHGETEPKYFAELGTTLKTGLGLPMFCNNKEENESICITWENEIFLRIKVLNSFCHEVNWNSPAEDCISYGSANWYGGPELYEQLWPVEKLIIKKYPYVTSSSSSLAEPFWINSKGIFVFVHYDVPLFIDSNNERSNSLCLISNNTFPYNPLQKRNVNLKYTFCQLNNPRKAYEYALQHKFIGVPSDIPDTRMVEHPIWSTWVQFKTDINETAVLNFADSIMYYGFNNSQLEIDDMWETCYGDIVLNETRFPNMKSFTQKLKKNGFRITLWHHPFVNTDCGNYPFLKNHNFFVKNSSGYDISHWWDGVGSVYDFTNPVVKQWFQIKHLAFLDENGIDGYKFDAGESSIIPMNSILNADPNDYPQSFTKAYIDTISLFGGITETRVGHGTQNYPIFVRMLDKDSKWDLKNGLATVITTCLLMNIQGYTWVLPDMVGGNAYGVSISEELFVRWLQVNTFMPVIQFSYAPWNFKNDTIIEISKKFTSLHYSYSSTIIDLMKRTVKTGAPLNPPIWWVDPTNPVAHRIDSEYMLGEDILVAPVLEEGATERDVYLPSGSWKDGNNGKNIYKGPRWIQKYPADLYTLPYFIKIPSQNK